MSNKTQGQNPDKYIEFIYSGGKYAWRIMDGRTADPAPVAVSPCDYDTADGAIASLLRYRDLCRSLGNVDIVYPAGGNVHERMCELCHDLTA